MSNLAKHARKLQASKRIPELEQLANSKNRHDTYLYLMHLQPSHFIHLKNAAREHLATSPNGDGYVGHYHEYPQIVLFNDSDYPLMDRLANPNVGFEQILGDIEEDNARGGGFWSSLKKTAHKAATVYSKINTGVGAVADIASKLPLPEKYKVLAESLKAGTQLHKGIADKIAHATRDHDDDEPEPDTGDTVDMAADTGAAVDTVDTSAAPEESIYDTPTVPLDEPQQPLPIYEEPAPPVVRSKRKRNKRVKIAN